MKSEADTALEESYNEQGSLDDLLIKVASGGFGLSLVVGAFGSGSDTIWLRCALFILLASVLAVILSKYLAVEGLRAYYVSICHEGDDERANARRKSERFDFWIRWINYTAGVLLAVGAALVAVHVVS